MFKEVLNYFKKIFNYFFYKIDYSIKTSGKIFVLEFKPSSHLDPKLISNEIIYCLNELIRKKYKEITIDESDFDDISYSIMILMSFSTIEGFRAHEKCIFSESVKNINEIDYKYFEKNVKKILVDILEKYNIDIIENLIIKVI